MNTARRHGPLSSALVHIARLGQYGHARSPKDFYMGDPDGREGPNTLYCGYYWSGVKFDWSFEKYVKVARLSKRYRRFCEYVEEVLPGWTVVETMRYADNSTEVVERARDGKKRTRMVVGPSGDACF